MSFEFDAVASLLKCPGCGASLIQADQSLVCANPEHRFSFPILDGIPQLLAEEALELSVDEWSSLGSVELNQQD
ncbi:MAG: hypothetical protein P8M30_07920 [Planctomycetaceae bacterium]|jgi:uncharacterized protein|nr:hypothetical protein [Planctomycetaceae bacterium]MDG2389232.1 hypothetical protein [Planctomycetaceae bacterium]